MTEVRKYTTTREFLEVFVRPTDSFEYLEAAVNEIRDARDSWYAVGTGTSAVTISFTEKDALVISVATEVKSVGGWT